MPTRKQLSQQSVAPLGRDFRLLILALGAFGLAWQWLAGGLAPAVALSAEQSEAKREQRMTAARRELPPAQAGPLANLLVNPSFGFHSFANSRKGLASAFCCGSVPGWDQEAYGDAEVFRAPSEKEFRPRFPIDGVVAIHPGKRFSQFVLLSEAGLDPGDRVSLSVFGWQSEPRSLRASLHVMQVDGAPGTWSPADFGHEDKRTFLKCARGELIPVLGAAGAPEDAGDFELKLENVELVGSLPEMPSPGKAAAPQVHRPRTIGVRVELANVSSSEAQVWVYSPCLSQGPQALNRLPEARCLPDDYRHIPRTMQKLWRGEPLHILHLGYSSDRGDANPPLYLYEEDPKSPKFKQSLQREFDGAKIGRPEWNDYIYRWTEYFMHMGRLRCSLARKYDYPMQNLLLNVMACGGSLLSEAHSGFADHASLTVPAGRANGHPEGKTWRELYPGLFDRPEGPGPDLVVVGHGARSLPGDVDEVEQYEGAVRWFQRRYPNVEFLFTVNDYEERFTHNAGALMELSLRYQIPYINFGRAFHLSLRYSGEVSPIPGDAHVQAYAHYLWYKQVEPAFEAVDPIQPGIAQVRLPERISPHTIGWEGDVQTYTAPHPRIRRDSALVLEDTVVNLWATCKGERVQVSLDGKPAANERCLPRPQRDVRNSTFAAGRLSMGDRHVVEVAGPEARLIAVDAKTALNRQWIGVESRRWAVGGLRPEPFRSEWGAPYGAWQVRLPAGSAAEIDVPGTFVSIAYVDQPGGGVLHTAVDGRDHLRTATNVPFRTAGGEVLHFENRKGVGPFPYGLHTIRVAAAGGPVALLGLFQYDTRSNRDRERVLRGSAFPGEVVSFNPPFQARPLLLCTGGLRPSPAGVTAEQVRFAGDGPGVYEIVGE